MGRIVLCVSLLLLLACKDETELPSYGGEVSIAYLRSLATERAVDLKYDYTIRGYVVANDKFGEVGYAFVVADDTGGVEIEVDARDVDEIVPLHAAVEVRCTGLTLGRVGEKICLGLASTDGYVVERIARREIYNRIKIDTAIEASANPEPRTIASLSAYDMLRYLRVDSLRALDMGAEWTDVDTLTRGRVAAIRRFTDGRDTLRVVTSGDCDYASHRLPEGLVSLSGILDWYDGAAAFRVTNHGITHLQ